MQKIFKKEIKDIKDEEIWKIFSFAKRELKKRGLVRTNNITGERGEFLVIDFFKNNSSLINLQAAPEGTQNVDALSRKGDRYSIKTISEPSKATGVFYNCGNIGDTNLPEKKFEYVLIVIIDKNLELSKMIELDWDKFLKYRKWHKTMRAWNLSVTRNLFNESKILFSK